EAETIAAAMRGLGEFADIARHDRDLAAEAEALDRAHREERPVIPGEGAGDAHHRVDDQRVAEDRHAPITLAEPTEDDRAYKLADIAGADQRAARGEGEVPGRYQYRQDIGDGERVETVEEPAGRDDSAHFEVPARE